MPPDGWASRRPGISRSRHGDFIAFYRRRFAEVGRYGAASMQAISRPLMFHIAEESAIQTLKMLLVRD